MLVSLRVRDLAVLEDVEVSFAGGLTVLTGETGAGKSLVVDALSLLSGERADATLVRSGAARAVVEGAFECDDPAVAALLAEAGLLPDEDPPAAPFEVVVRREVATGGKGRLFVNGSPAAVRTLADVAPRLLVLYGQAEARDLVDPAVPREVLDRFAGLAAEAERTAALWHSYREREADRARLAGAAVERARRLDLLEYELREIDAVRPADGEEERLAAEKLALGSVERRGALLAEALSALESEDGGALRALSTLRKALQGLSEVDPSAAARLAQAEELVEKASDLAAGTSRDLDRLEADPERLAAVAERLDALAKLKRKYGPSLAEVLAHRERAARERDDLVDLEGAVSRAEEAARASFEAYRAAALSLSAGRAAAAPRLGKAVERHLGDLSFLKASFGVEVTRRTEPAGLLEAGGERVACGAHGVDQVVLAFAPNPGEPPRPLGRIASGGELSRVQLALAAALAEEEARRERGGRTGPPSRRRGGPVRTFVFDEVDAGVSGATAEAVGRKLRTLAGRDQILVVTHLPQVAAAGERHLLVAKETESGRTRTRVSELAPKERVEAIASLLAGAQVGTAARQQARQLLAAHSEPDGR